MAEDSPWTSPRAPADGAGDQLLRAIVAQRAARAARSSLGLGFTSVVVLGTPFLSNWFPFFVLGLFTVLPVVLGATAIAGGALAIHTVLVPPPGVDVVLTGAQRWSALGIAAWGASLGLLGVVGGVLMYLAVGTAP